MTDCGSEASNNTTQTQSKTISLNTNSPARFQAIGSVDRLHLTSPGVVKKNDQVMAKVITPISEPTAAGREKRRNTKLDYAEEVRLSPEAEY